MQSHTIWKTWKLSSKTRSSTKHQPLYQGDLDNLQPDDELNMPVMKKACLLVTSTEVVKYPSGSCRNTPNSKSSSSNLLLLLRRNILDLSNNLGYLGFSCFGDFTDNICLFFHDSSLFFGFFFFFSSSLFCGSLVLSTFFLYWLINSNRLLFFFRWFINDNGFFFHWSTSFSRLFFCLDFYIPSCVYNGLSNFLCLCQGDI
mmetsp:Transcript_21429/g.27374  ORF Transcript_21429/g.27374 Transcript_21429/m.27374 type:complete len:201 (+) Transcript_21429:166-768(+)